jgi:hypothetical protein
MFRPVIADGAVLADLMWMESAPLGSNPQELGPSEALLERPVSPRRDSGLTRGDDGDGGHDGRGFRGPWNGVPARRDVGSQNGLAHHGLTER